MNPTDGTNADNPSASREQAHDDAGVYRDTPAATWDPYEVWLTRIKQPRERAARIARPSSPGRTIIAREIAPAR
jgi:hypothetical protein